MEWLIILSVGVVSGVLGGVVGFGASLLTMPLLVFYFGAKETVPIMAIAALMANASRAFVWWREIDWKVNAAYCATAVPAAAIGANLLVKLDQRAAELTLGVFFLVMIPVRRWLLARGFRMTLPGMALVGAGIGLLTGLVAATGPINTPFFLAYGLNKGAFLATEAVGAGAISLTKATVFGIYGALTPATLLRGVLVGTTFMIGSLLAKRIVMQMDASQFRWLLEAMMALAGIVMIGGALR